MLSNELCLSAVCILMVLAVILIKIVFVDDRTFNIAKIAISVSITIMCMIGMFVNENKVNPIKLLNVWYIFGLFISVCLTGIEKE